MKTWDIRIVDAHGNPVSQKRALLRYALAWMWFLPPLAISWVSGLQAIEASVLAMSWIAIWAILAKYHPQAQFWHDAWAGTRLVTWRAPESRRNRVRQEDNFSKSTPT